MLTAPVPRDGTREREMPPCLCVWRAGSSRVASARCLGMRGTSGHTAESRLAHTCWGATSRYPRWHLLMRLGGGGCHFLEGRFLVLPQPPLGMWSHQGRQFTHGGVAVQCVGTVAGWRAQRWPTPAVAYSHNGPRAYGCMRCGRARATSPGGEAVSKATLAPWGWLPGSANRASAQHKASGGESIRCTGGPGCHGGSTGKETCN